MARINYKVDKELAMQGLLRVSVVAKALNLAPKTVNLWTKYPVSKIGGVKYLSWHDVITDKPHEQQTYRLSDVANEVYNKLLLNDYTIASAACDPEPLKPTVAKVNDALAKAKALLTKAKPVPPVTVSVAIPLPTPPEFIQFQEEILTVTNPDPEVLTIHPDYKHLLRK